ncbi:MAG TPA: hypothetical protein VFO83_06090, partial [Aggregicoccus sp.]|nr:hypothetical protein [Aggregicoccus sp.]
PAPFVLSPLLATAAADPALRVGHGQLVGGWGFVWGSYALLWGALIAYFCLLWLRERSVALAAAERRS